MEFDAPSICGSGLADKEKENNNEQEAGHFFYSISEQHYLACINEGRQTSAELLCWEKIFSPDVRRSLSAPVTKAARGAEAFQGKCRSVFYR